MLGMNKAQMQSEIGSRVRNTLISFPEYQNLRQILDRVAESVAEVIAKNNAEIEQKLRAVGIKL